MKVLFFYLLYNGYSAVRKPEIDHDDWTCLFLFRTSGLDIEDVRLRVKVYFYTIAFSEAGQDLVFYCNFK